MTAADRKADIAVIGLAVMGQNLVLNLADHGYRVAVHNRSPQRVDDLLARAESNHDLRPTTSVAELVAITAAPRVVMLMVQAGQPVDDTIAALTDHLEPGDIVIDGGNSHWTDTARRLAELNTKGIELLGAGISGGEDGARNGPAIMVGGEGSAWSTAGPILTRIAARSGPGLDEPCCQLVGPGGAGHFVKMVHNGIEYGDMQVLAEAYALLRASGISPVEQAALFSAWNLGDLKSFLVEITATILSTTEPDGRPTIDVILDTAGQKGTGRWTVNAAMDLGQPMMLVTEAVGARLVSAQHQLRQDLAALYRPSSGLETAGQPPAPDIHPQDIASAIQAAKLISYAQGFMVLAQASEANGWHLDLGAIARLWRGGCIIRAAFLDDLAGALDDDPTGNLLGSPYVTKTLGAAIDGLRSVAAEAVKTGIAAPALASAVAFFDGMTARRSSAALIQAQRDYFGAHTYERVDAERGRFFHTDWLGQTGSATAGSYRS